jgi:hypothetical protein
MTRDRSGHIDRQSRDRPIRSFFVARRAQLIPLGGAHIRSDLMATEQYPVIATLQLVNTRMSRALKGAREIPSDAARCRVLPQARL